MMTCKTAIAAEAGVTAQDDIDKLEAFSNAALLPVGQSIKAASDIPRRSSRDESGPDLLAALEFEPGWR